MDVKTYGIEKESLDRMLGEAASGSTQLPDFQRGWVWDDDHVRSLPIGAVMMLRAGGETVRFKQRPLEGAPAPGDRETERLILDWNSASHRCSSPCVLTGQCSPETNADEPSNAVDNE